MLTTSGSNESTITVPTDVAGTFEYELLSVEDPATGCGQPVNETVTVTVNPLPDASIAGTITVCQEDTSPVITLTGTNSSGEYAFTYSLNGGASTTLTTSGSNESTITVPTDVAGTFEYELLSVEDPATGCGQPVNETVTVIVNPLPTATISQDVTVCQGDPSQTLTFTGTNGSSEYKFTYNLNGGPSQTITTNGSNTATITVPTDVFGTFTYTLEAVEDVSTGCGQPQTSTATVIVNEMPNATISGTVTVCQNEPNPVVTFTGTSGLGSFTFSYTVNGGPVQTVTTNGTPTATVTQSTTYPGTYVYELVNVAYPSSGCNQDLNESITVIVKELPLASISAPIEVCHLDQELPEVTITGSGGTSPYTFTYTVNGGAPLTGVSTQDQLVIPISTSMPGTYLVNVTYVQEGSSNACGQIQDISTLITVHALPTVVAGNDFPSCAGEPIVLSGAGANTYVWDNGVINGQPFSPTVTTTYTVVGTDINGCQDTDQVTVTVIPIPTVDIVGTNVYGCSPVTATFTNNSTGNLTGCTWYLGNGEV